MKKLILLIGILQVFIIRNSFPQPFWQPATGPISSDPLYIYCVDVREDGVLFASENSRGLFRSTDNGNYWLPINYGLGEATTYSIAFDHQNVIYAGTFDGVFRSTNDGLDWTNLSNITGTISLELNSEGHIFVGTAGSGVYRSTDSGSSWLAINTGIPTGGRVISAILANQNGDLFVGTNDGIYRSTNNGNYWIHYPNIVETIQDIKNTGLGYLIAGSFYSGTAGNFYLSTDNGNNWTLKWNNNIGISCLAVDHNTDYIYAGTGYDGIYVTTDLGNNWTKVSDMVPNNNVGAIAISTQGNIFEATMGDGVFKSTDSGINWTEINNGFAYPHILSQVINSQDIIFVGSDEGIFKSNDLGENWIFVGLPDLDISSLAVNSGDDIFAGTSYDGKIYISTDNGENWEHIGPYIGPLISSITINKDDVIFVGTFGMGEGGVFRSTDNGNSWQPVISGLDVLCIAINSNDDLFAGTRNSIKRSTDNGNTWIDINYIFPSSGIGDIAINSNDVIFAGTMSGVFRSTDDGNNWIGVNNGLSDSSIVDLVINSNDLIFAGITWTGVFFSSDNGDNWQEINAGLTDYGVTTFTLDSSGFIYVGTISHGIFRSVNSTITEIKNTESMNYPFYLIQNYPNPFNPTTIIKYQIPELRNVRLTVYDVLGREVQTLVNEEKQAGNYEVEFDGTGLPSGVYFYKIESGNFSDTKKIVLLK